MIGIKILKNKMIKSLNIVSADGHIENFAFLDAVNINCHCRNTVQVSIPS